LTQLQQQVLKLMEKFGIGDETKQEDAASIGSGSGAMQQPPLLFTSFARLKTFLHIHARCRRK